MFYSQEPCLTGEKGRESRLWPVHRSAWTIVMGDGSGEKTGPKKDGSSYPRARTVHFLVQEIKQGRKAAYMDEQGASDYPQTQKEVCRRWKQGQGTKNKYRDGVQGRRQVKTHLELNLERVTKAKKGSFYRSIISKRKPKENL